MNAKKIIIGGLTSIILATSCVSTKNVVEDDFYSAPNTDKNISVVAHNVRAYIDEKIYFVVGNDAPVFVDSINYASLPENRIDTNQYILLPKFKTLEEFDKVKISSTRMLPEKYVAQKIDSASNDMLPFILESGNQKYAFVPVETSQGKLANKVVIYDPIILPISVLDLDSATIVTEDVYPTKKDAKSKEVCSLNPVIFDKKYVSVPVPMNEEQYGKTDFYLIEKDSKTVQINPIYRNITLNAPEGKHVYRGILLDEKIFNPVAREYSLE